MAGMMPELEVPFGRLIRVYHGLDVRLVLEDMFCKFELWALGAASAWGTSHRLSGSPVKTRARFLQFSGPGSSRTRSSEPTESAYLRFCGAAWAAILQTAQNCKFPARLVSAGLFVPPPRPTNRKRGRAFSRPDDARRPALNHGAWLGAMVPPTSAYLADWCASV